MTPLRPGIRRLFRLDRWKREDAARDLRDEMELHVALRTEELIRGGMSPADAEGEARRLFALNDTTLIDLHDTAFDRNRHMRMRDRWDTVWQDIRYAARRLVREPAITAFILCTLALGIGINVAAFSVVDRVLLRGPQFVRDPHRLVRLYSQVSQPPIGIQTSPWLPHPTFAALRGHMRTIESIGAYRPGEAMVGRGATSEIRRVSLMSSEMFGMLGVTPIKGRFYGASEDADKVAVLGERYWRTVLGADPDIIGKTIVIDDDLHRIVGVAPAGFTGPDLRRVDMWTPIKIDDRNSMNMKIVARMKPGATADGVAREVAQNRPQIEASLPRWASWLRGAQYIAAPIAYDDTGRRSFEAVMASWLAAISAIILFASCANVANLLLARLARRRRELAVRMALGSGRGRVMRLLGIEGFLFAAAAAVLAIAVILVVEPIVQRALFPEGSWAFSLVDRRLLGAAAVFTLLTGMLVSVVPAIQAGGREVSDTLRGGNQGGEARSPLRSGLTIVQAMLSVVLLVGAGLFVRSLQRVNAVDLGMTPDRLLTVEMHYANLPRTAGESFGDWLGRAGAVERIRYSSLVDAVRRVPGVAKATISVGALPFGGSVSVGLWLPSGDSVPTRPGNGPFVTGVGTDYFTTTGTTIHRGRAFTANDREGSEAVIIVNETMARALWRRDDAIGKCVVVAARGAPCARVVGIAADRHISGLREEPSMQFYVPIGQERGFGGSSLIVRPTGELTTAWPALREALEHADPAIQAVDVRRLSAGLDGEMRPLRLGMTAFGLSAALALIVAGLGLYSIMAHAVAWRRHEIGVRLALGARPYSIATLIVGRGAVLATTGIGLGLIAAFAARRWVQPLLFDTSATDPIVLAGVALALEAVALLAGWLPALRAVSVSPTEALRAE